MIIEPKKLSARGARVDIGEVNILLNLVKESSPNVRLNILDTLTHLPLPEQGWDKVIELLSQELGDTTSYEDKAQLLEIGIWIPYEFNLESEVVRIEKKPIVQKRLLDEVKRIHNRYNNDYIDYDHNWAVSQAPGFVLFSESELKTQKSLLLPEISKTASKLLNWWSNERSPDIAIDNPVLITLLFEFAAKDNYYEVLMINNLLKQLARLENFRPDLNGLFEEYHQCVTDWIRETSSYYGKQSARWFQLYRDDEHSISWRSWQIAWTISRGGLRGLISALAIYLTGKDETRQIAALALISDSADYALQKRAAEFGGGIRPPRLDPNLAHRFWLSDVKVNEQTADNLQVNIDLKQLLTDIGKRYFKISIGHPKLISKRYEAPFVVQLYFEELADDVKKKIEEIVGENFAESIYNTELKFGQVVKIKLFSPDITFSEPIVKKLDSSLNTMIFLGKPLDTCQPCIHKIVISITDNKTGIEYQAETISVKVVDFAFDHVSRPLLSKVSTVILGASSFVMFILTLLAQIDKTLGYTSGTAAFVLGTVVFANFYKFYQRIHINTP
ncbi:MAG: hypothetical protein CV087_21690 [Candidatus Brocadia sp. WS118]|nr:MAG: hypothetical protein CV087_21690 [Candidatus Brocadia sp. WS118]